MKGSTSTLHRRLFNVHGRDGGVSAVEQRAEKRCRYYKHNFNMNLNMKCCSTINWAPGS